MPAEFSTRYREQFFDRLWLHGLFATGILYGVCVAIYFCATSVLGYQTGKVEQQVAALSGSYTNALQLKARYEVLKERQDLKYAALDCWKLVAEQLPAGISLQRFSFGDGHRLSLNGTVAPIKSRQITDFYDALRKAQLNGQPMFNAEGRRPTDLPPERQPGELEFQPGIAAHGGGAAMKKYFAQLRPLERRLAIGVLVVVFLVLNYVFVWPHFSDWGNLHQPAGRGRGRN